MASTLRYSDAPYILFSDFDGTITTADSNDTATDNIGFGKERRLKINEDILNLKVGFRDGFREMIDSIAANHPFEYMRDWLTERIQLDPGFKETFEWCEAQTPKIPVVIVSSGMVPIIRSIMEKLVGVEAASRIDIIANDVEYREDGSWGIKFRHPDNSFGHDKSLSTGPYRELPHRPTLFFCGDGVSDLSAARAADLLFVKVIPNHTNDLSKYCLREEIPFVQFAEFSQVKTAIEAVVTKTKTIPELLADKPAGLTTP